MRSVAMMIGAIAMVGCAGTPVIPPELKHKIDPNVSFQQIKEAPLSHKESLVVVGGMVLSIKPLKQDGTRIEILQLPLDRSYEPKGRLTDSRGRFLAFHGEFIGPATMPIGTPITVVGEVSGSMTLQVDDMDYSYPTFAIKSLTIWVPQTLWWRPYPYSGAFWGPYWGTYWGPPQSVPWPGERR